MACISLLWSVLYFPRFYWRYYTDVPVIWRNLYMRHSNTIIERFLSSSLHSRISNLWSLFWYVTFDKYSHVNGSSHLLNKGQSRCPQLLTWLKSSSRWEASLRYAARKLDVWPCLTLWDTCQKAIEWMASVALYVLCARSYTVVL